MRAHLIVPAALGNTMSSRRLIVPLACLLLATPAAAQDLSPVIDPGQVAQGQVLGDMVTNHGKLAARRRSPANGTAAQVAACRQKGYFRTRFGAGHPKVRQLYRLCRGIGR